MRRLGLALMIFVFYGLAQTTLAQDHTFIRIAHLSIDAGEVDLYADDTLLYSAVSYGDVSNWTTIEPSTTTLTVVTSGISPENEAGIIEKLETELDGGAWFTVTVIGLRGQQNLTAQAIQEDFSPLEPGEARLTLLHALSNTEAVTILADSELLAAGLGFPGTQGDNDGVIRLDLPARTYDLDILLADMPDTVLFDLDDTVLYGNRYYFAAMTGLPDAPEWILVSTIPADVKRATNQPEQVTSGTAHLRFGHFSIDSPPIDIRIDEVPEAVNGLQYPGLSQWMSIDAGNHLMTITPSGDTNNDLLLAPIEFELESDEWYTLALIGYIEDNSLHTQVIDENYSEIPNGESRFTIFHAVPGGPNVDVQVNGTTFVSNLAFPGLLGDNDGAQSFTVIAGSYNFQITPTNDPDTVLIDLPDTELAAGNHYFIAAINRPSTISYFIDRVDQSTVR